LSGLQFGHFGHRGKLTSLSLLLLSLGDTDCLALSSLRRQYDLRENSKRSEVLIDLTEYCGQLVEAKCLTVNPQDNNYLAVGASGPFVRLYDIRMIHNHR